MQHRNPAAVFFLSLITFGIYALVWHVKTKNELNSLGAKIPTAWLLIVPLANLYWVWKYCEGVEQVSEGKISAVLALILMLLLSIVGYAILQGEYNKLNLQAAAPGTAPGPAPQAVAYVPPASVDPLSSTPVSPDTGGFTSSEPSQPEPSQPEPSQPEPSQPTDAPPSPPAPLVQ